MYYSRIIKCVFRIPQYGNRYLKYALFAVLLSFPEVVSAQFNAGYRFGINLTSMVIETAGLTSNPETPVGIQLGGYFEVPVRKHLSLLSGLIFTSKGTDYRIDSTDYSLAPTYIEIPVNLSYTIGSKSVRLSLFAGPYSAFAIGGYKIVSGNELEYLSLGSGENKDLKVLDFGFNFGAGIKIKSYVICVQYGMGLTNVSPANDIEMKNRVIGISITPSK